MVQDGKLTQETLVWNSEPGNAEKGWVIARDTELAALFIQNTPLSPAFPAIPELSPQVSATGSNVQATWRPPQAAFERQEPARARESGPGVATLKSRFFALLIDSLISLIMALAVMIICVLLFRLLPYLFSLLGLFYETAYYTIMMYYTVPVTGVLVTSLINTVLIYKRGQTFGKKITGLRITRAGGRKRSFIRNTVLRSLVKILLLMPPLVILDLCPLFWRDGQTLHDLIGGTVVISER
jgi:uncharacterized RDD family membrane protein YckC